MLPQHHYIARAYQIPHQKFLGLQYNISQNVGKELKQGAGSSSELSDTRTSLRTDPLSCFLARKNTRTSKLR